MNALNQHTGFTKITFFTFGRIILLQTKASERFGFFNINTRCVTSILMTKTILVKYQTRNKPVFHVDE